MKKILAILLALVVMLSFAACGADNADNGDGAAAGDDAHKCHECGNALGDDDEGWMSSVYDEDGNMIDVYICDECWEAESDPDADAGATGDADVDAGATADEDTTADIDAGATDDADVDAGATGDDDTTAGGGYDRVPQNSLDNINSDDETYTCCECGKKMTFDEASIVATSAGDKDYYCSDCYEDWLNS